MGMLVKSKREGKNDVGCLYSVLAFREIGAEYTNMVSSFDHQSLCLLSTILHHPSIPLYHQYTPLLETRVFLTRTLLPMFNGVSIVLNAPRMT